MVPSPPSSSEEDGGAAGAERAAASPPPPRRLHNFSFPSLSWGTTRLLRCSKIGLSSSSTEQSPPPLPPPPPIGDRKSAGDRVETAAARPWNLRTRRAACAMPGETARRRKPIPFSSSPSPEKEVRSGRLGPEVGVENGVRRKFSVSLSKEEIEEDFLAMKGSRPPRRPKKRPRIVQKQLDSLFPGLWLSEISLDTYKTND